MKRKILVILAISLSIGLSSANKLENWINPSIEGSIQQDALNSATRSAKYLGGTVSYFETKILCFSIHTIEFLREIRNVEFYGSKW